MAEKWKDRLTDQLCTAFLSLKTPDEVYRFLEDVSTVGEIRTLAHRLENARLFERRAHVSSDRATDGGKHGDDQPYKEIFGIWFRWVQARSGTDRERGLRAKSLGL